MEGGRRRVRPCAPGLPVSTACLHLGAPAAWPVDDPGDPTMSEFGSTTTTDEVLDAMDAESEFACDAAKAGCGGGRIT